jgi:chemotaxis protein methyltransferase CheR
VTGITEEVFNSIKEVVFEKSGLDIGNYKDKCIKRRIAVRLRATGCEYDREYLEKLKLAEGEINRLLKALTINVTQFFRNAEVFEKIKEEVFPLIFREKKGYDPVLNIWSVGCSSGEEPYSLAIILKEYFERELRDFSVAILATDFDHEVINNAKEGRYREKSLIEMTPELIDKYFSITNDGLFSIDPEIRKMVTFKRKNILESVQNKEIDMIICRNMLIYFSREYQNEILLKFVDALSDSGFLVLGKAETLVSESRSLLNSVSTRERIFRKK